MPGHSGGLTKWFKEGWVDISRPRKGGGYAPCGGGGEDWGNWSNVSPPAAAHPWSNWRSAYAEGEGVGGGARRGARSWSSCPFS